MADVMSSPGAEAGELRGRPGIGKACGEMTVRRTSRCGALVDLKGSLRRNTAAIECFKVDPDRAWHFLLRLKRNATQQELVLRISAHFVGRKPGLVA